MKNTISPTSLLDYLGLISLAGAAATLAAALWFGGVSAEATLFGAFHICMAIGMGCFLANRVSEIARVIMSAPDPKHMRTVAARNSNSNAVAADQSNITDGKFRRAA